MTVTRKDIVISAADMQYSEIGPHRMLGIRVQELLDNMDKLGCEGAVTLTFLKHVGGYKVFAQGWKPERKPD